VSLTREEILAARKDRRPARLEVEEWGGAVYVKHLTVADQMELAEHTKPADMPIAVLVACLVDENEEPIFSPADADELSREAFSVVLKVFGFAAKLNGLSTAELEDAVQSFGQARIDPPDIGSDSRSGSPDLESSVPRN
jgi:hypothetical protein